MKLRRLMLYTEMESSDGKIIDIVLLDWTTPEQSEEFIRRLQVLLDPKEE